jgi:CubicO group peptidase (beta-lactamase class C family)
MKALKQLTIFTFMLFVSIGFSQEKSLQTIQEKYNTLLQEQNKGVGVLIKKNNKINTLQLGNHQLTEQKVFNIGSATKTFTAILFLQEAEKGNLKLTDSIGAYLSPIKNVDGALTIETLLSHESGLDEVVGKNILDIYYSKDDALLNSNLLDEIEENDPKMIGKYDYCNTNYLLLGKIIEKITDKNYFDLVIERIFERLNMDHTYPYVSKNIKNLATPFSASGKDISEHLDYRYFANICNAAGSIASTLTDMEIFYTSLFETEILLKKESLKLMMNSGNETYGLGLFKPDNINNYFGHGGNNIGYSFRNGYNPKTKNLFLLFANEMYIPFQKNIKKDITTFINDEEIEGFKKVDKKFKSYAGKYLIKKANLILEVVVEGDKIFIASEAQGFKNPLFQKDENTFFDPQLGVSLTLIADNNKALTFNQNGFETIINRIEKDTDIKDSKQKNTDKIDVSFHKYIGKFLLKEANLVLEIVVEGDKMFMVSEEQGLKSQLFQKNKTILFETVAGANIEVITDNDDALTFSQNGFTTTINRIK